MSTIFVCVWNRPPKPLPAGSPAGVSVFECSGEGEHREDEQNVKSMRQIIYTKKQHKILKTTAWKSNVKCKMFKIALPITDSKLNTSKIKVRPKKRIG